MERIFALLVVACLFEHGVAQFGAGAGPAVPPLVVPGPTTTTARKRAHIQ